MWQIVARTQTRRPSAFFDRPIAGEITPKTSVVGAEQGADELTGLFGIFTQDRTQARFLGGIRFVQPGQAIFLRAISNIFMIRGAGLPLAQQKFALLGRERERSARKKKNIAAFELLAQRERAAARVRTGGSPGRF